MTQPQSVFSTRPGNIVSIPSLELVGPYLDANLKQYPTLHFLIFDLSPTHTTYLLTFDTWRKLPSNHDLAGARPLFSGTYETFRRLATGFPDDLFDPDHHAPDA